MTDRPLVLVAVGLVSLIALAAPVAADDSTVDRAEGDPIRTGLQEGVRLVDEGATVPIVRVFHEDWDDHESLDETGWRAQTVNEEDPAFRIVHRTEDNPFQEPQPTPIATESRPRAVTVMAPDGTYGRGLDTRLVSPTIDLRYVPGASQSTAAAHDDEDVGGFLRDLQAAYEDEVQGQSRLVGPYGFLVGSPPSGWAPAPCHPPDSFHCEQIERGTYPGIEDAGPLEDERRGSEAFEGDDRRVTVATPGVQLFGFPVLQPQRESQAVPVPGTRDHGLYADDGRVFAPNPVDRREGAAYVNLTFWHKWDLWERPGGRDAAFLEVRERRADGEWSEWRHLEPAEVWSQPGVDTSAAAGSEGSTDRTTAGGAAHEQASGERTTTYNGWKDDRRAFVGSSDGVVASTFNLNRFAGAEVQLAWRFDSTDSLLPDAGWFVDDVVVWTDTHAWDVGVRQVERPDDGDQLASGDPVRPSATLRNYGYQTAHDVDLTFEIASTENDTVVWRDSQVLDRLAPQEERTLASTTAFEPPSEGSFRLVTNVTPYEPPQDPREDNLTHRPETNPDDRNDEEVVPFHVRTEADADVQVTLQQGSVQTDLHEEKTVTVAIENLGNVPLSGPVTVTATKLNRTDLTPAGEPHPIDTTRIRPGELPFGPDLNAYGAEENTWTRTFTWDENLDEAGIYRVEARLSAEPGNFTGADNGYIRATPTPYYDEDADTRLDLPFDQDSVYRAGMQVDAWIGEGEGSEVDAHRALPDPASPTHVWYARGDDGDLGTAGYGDEAESAAGEDLAEDDLYRSPEPDEKCLDPERHFGGLSCLETRDPNLVDHYWLTREVNLTAYENASTIRLTFWHAGEFNWTGRPTGDEAEADHSRGRVEVLPRRNAVLADPTPEEPDEASQAGEAAPDEAPEAPLEPGDGLRFVAAEDVYAQPVATYEDSVPWTRETLDLSKWAGEEVVLRFHLESTASRLRVNSSATQDQAGETAPEGPGPLDPWLVDDVTVTAREDGEDRTVLSTDLEGQSWRNWSTSEGLRVEDPEAPATVAEGRGWARFGYGEDTFRSGWSITSSRERPVDGVPETSPMFRWGDRLSVTSDKLPQDVNVSVLRTPSFSLADSTDPQLAFLHKYGLPSDWTAYPGSNLDSQDPHVTTGASVWIVGEDEDGEVVKRELLTPSEDAESRYDGYIRNWNVEDSDFDDDEAQTCRSNEVHCETPLVRYPNRTTLEASPRFDDPGGNVFTGYSGVDESQVPPDEDPTPRWTRATLDLSDYASPENRSLDYHLEFHAVDQRSDQAEALGWLVDEVEITESTFANDLALAEVVNPDTDDPVGPGLKVPFAVRVNNPGIYTQTGAEIAYEVRDTDGNVVFGPVTETTTPGTAVPGERSADPDRNLTTIFERPWTTPAEEGTYVLVAEVDLSGAPAEHAFPDDNPANDVLRETIEVTSTRSVSLAPAEVQPDAEVVDPFVAGTDTVRSLSVLVRNDGTLPEVFTGEDAGHFNVSMTIHDEKGDLLTAQTTSIRRLDPGGTQEVAFPNAWTPPTTGSYDITFTLNHPNETVPDAGRDNTRSISYNVLGQIFPDDHQDPESAFRAEDPGWGYQEGSWVFGTGESYRADADDVLRLAGGLDLRDLRQGVVRLNHTYDLEQGYDAAVLEIRPRGADEWYPVPPRPGDDYPDPLTPASPLSEDPTEPTLALSGTSGDGPEPAPVEDVFDLSAVEPLRTRSSIFEDPMEHGWGAADSALRGDWSHTYLSDVEPHGGDVMFHSNHSGVVRDCDGFYAEDGSGDCGTISTKHDSRKHLNVTFADDFPPGRTPLAERAQDGDVSAVQFVFWDYRSIAPLLPDESEAGTPNEVSVRLECVGDGCPDGASLTLDEADEGGYDDNYRGWTRNVYEVKPRQLEAFAGPDRALRLSLTHHLTVQETDSLWATDRRSIHAGWFVDDVAVELVDQGGSVSTYWEDDLEAYDRTRGPGGENLTVGPWSGSGWWLAHDDGSTGARDRLLWDPVASWGEPLWRHVEQGELPCGPLVNEHEDLRPDSRRSDAYDADNPAGTNYTAGTDHFRACGPTAGHRDRAGGDRLVTDLDLRTAVDDVTLAFDHKFRFRHDRNFGDPPMETRSGGRLEVSPDGGDTWIPVEPRMNEPGKGFAPAEVSIEGPPYGTHSTLGGPSGDPEGNSDYGIGGTAFTGVSGPAQTNPQTETAFFDLSRFAGQKVKVAWHASFGSHASGRYPGGTPEMGYEFWAVDNVTVDADVVAGDEADLRLRAVSDGSNAGAGWTVHDLQVIGTGSDVNLAVEVLGLDATTPAGETDFSVALENRGETAIPADAEVTVRRPGAEEPALEVGTDDPIRLPAEGSGARVERATLGGDDLSLVLQSGNEYVVEATATVADEDLRNAEVVRGDNQDTQALTDVRSGSRLVAQDLSVEPNNVPSGVTSPVRVEATVLNDGFERSVLDYSNLTLVLNHTRADAQGLELRGQDALAEDPGKSLGRPFETRTYVWTIEPGRLHDLDEGLYEATVTVQEEGAFQASTATEDVFLGDGFLEDHAYHQPVRNLTLRQHATCGYSGQAESAGGGPGGAGDPTWATVGSSNRSPYRSFGRVESEGDPGYLFCRFDNMNTLREDLFVTFYTRYQFGGTGGYTVEVRDKETSGACSAEDDLLRSRTFAHDGLSPGFARDKYIRRTVPVPGEGTEDEAGCVGWKVRNSFSTFVDDVLVAPYNVEVTPETTTAPVQDDTLKRFPVQVTNEGAFNDTYRFAFVDEVGEPTQTPAGWDVAVEDAQGETVETLEVPAGATRTAFLTVEIPVQSAASSSGSNDVHVTAVSETTGLIRDTATFDFRFDYPPRPDLKVVDASVNGEGLPAGQPRTVSVTVANVGLEPVEDVAVTITDTMPPRFGQAPGELERVEGGPLPTVDLEPGETTTRIAGWTPENSGPHNLTVRVDPDGDVVEPTRDDNVEVLTIPVGAERFPDLVADVTVGDATPQAGSTIAVNATVTNQGTAPAVGTRLTLRVGVEDLLGGEAPHILDEPIEPGETVTLHKSWSASFPGDYPVIVKAFPLSGTLEPTDTQDDNLQSTDVTVRSKNLRLQAPEEPLAVGQGQEASTGLTLENGGDRDETVDVAASAEGQVRARLLHEGVGVTSVDVPSESVRNVTLEVQVPGEVVADTYPVTVRLTSEATGQTETTRIPVEVQVDHGLEVEARGVDVDPGGGVVPVQVTNTGNAPAGVAVTAGDLPEDWSAETVETEVGPFASTRVEVALDVPTDAPAGVRDVAVGAASADASDAVPVRVEVGTRSVVDAAVRPGDVEVRPGTTLEFNATLASVGNVPAHPDLRVEAPDDWTVHLPRPSTQIDRGDSLTLPVTVRVPAEAEPGDREVRVLADAGDEVFAGNASVLVGIPDVAVTNVEQTPRVNVEAGQEVEFRAALRNVGGLDAGEVGVGLHVDDPRHGFVTVDEVPAGGQAEATLNWTAQAGEHVVLVVADPGERIEEEDEGNNARVLVLQVAGQAQVFGDVQRAVPAPAFAAVVLASLGAAVGRRWAG